MEREPYLRYVLLFTADGQEAGWWCPVFFGEKQERPPELRPPVLFTIEELNARGR